MTHILYRLLPLVLVASASADSFTAGDLTIHVADGFSIERIATTELAPRPISAAFDDRGRFFVTDSGGMSDGAEKQIEAKPHRLLRLVDTDGDGKFDRQTVFADKLMFPEGCLFAEGSIYVAAPPEIWKFTDADDDGVAEKREVWFDGKTLTHCGNDLHGPYAGRDGYFYWTKGAYAEQHYTLPNGRPLDTHAAHIFRARPDASMLEPVLTGGMANPVGVAFTSAGGRFLSGTFFVTPADGKRDGLIHSIYGGVYGMDRDSLSEHPMTGAVMPILAQSGASAPCGMTCVQSEALGAGFRDNLITCYFNLHKIMRHQLVPDGATFRTQDSDLVWSDLPDFHPTDVVEDADGSLIVLDTGGWYKVCCPTSQLAKPDVLGGIYRVRRKGMPAVADARGANIDWLHNAPAELAKLLDDPRHVVRERAIRALSQRGEAAVESLEAVLRSGARLAKQNALWTLSRVDAPAARAAVRAALEDADAAVVQPALQIIALWRDDGARERAEALLSSADAAVARDAAEALGRIGSKASVPVLLQTTGRLPVSAPSIAGCPVDAAQRVVEHSLIYALIEIGDAVSTGEGLRAANVATRRAALVALDQMMRGGLQSAQVTSLLEEDDITLRNTAAWIVSHHPEWGDALAGHFRSRLLQPTADENVVDQLAKLAKSPAIIEVIATSARSGSLPALRAMAAASPREAPASWLDSLAEVLGHEDARPLSAAVAAAQALPWPKGGHKPVMHALIALGERETCAVQLRLDALAAARNVPDVSDGLFRFLLDQLAPEQAVAARNASATVLSRAGLTDAQRLELAGALARVGPLELPKLLPAFERGASVPLGQRLIAVLQDAAGFSGLRADLIKTLFAKYPTEVQTASEGLLSRLNTDFAKQAAQLADVLGKLPSGDVRRGQAVFLRAGCIACHRIGYAGGTLGPDVTNIGKVRTPRDLLEAILFPSASIVRGYEIYAVTTRSGEAFAGTLAKDDHDEIILNIAPQLRQRIARDRITQMNPVNLSLMPQGFGDLLKPQDLADLLAFLRPAAVK